MYKHHGKRRPAWHTGETVTREPGLLCDSRHQGQQIKVHDLMSAHFFIVWQEKCRRAQERETLIRVHPRKGRWWEVSFKLYSFTFSSGISSELLIFSCAFIDQDILLSEGCGHSNNMDNDGGRTIDTIIMVYKRANHLYFIQCNALFIHMQ